MLNNNPLTLTTETKYITGAIKNCNITLELHRKIKIAFAVIFIIAVLVKVKKFISLKIERSSICKYCGCDPKELIKISPDKLKDLSKYVPRGIGLKFETGSQGNIFFAERSHRESYSKAIALKENPEFLHKRYSDLIYFESKDDIFKTIYRRGYSLILNEKISSEVIEEDKFKELMIDISKSVYKDFPDFSELHKTEFENVKRKINAAKGKYILDESKNRQATKSCAIIDTSKFDNCYKVIGTTKDNVYLIHSKDALNDYL